MIGRFETFTFAISAISQYWSKIALEEMKNYGLKGTCAIYLVELYRNPEGITATKLSEISGRDKAEISRAVSALEKKGLVERENVSSNSYRALIKLTDEGKKATELVRERVKIAVELGGKGVDEHDREIFYKALEKIASNLKEISKEGLPK